MSPAVAREDERGRPDRGRRAHTSRRGGGADEQKEGGEYKRSSHEADPGEDANEASKGAQEQHLSLRNPDLIVCATRGWENPSHQSVAVTTDILPPRYRGPQQIGRGGMGDIYRATDATLGRDVAIKILAARYAQDATVRERFTRESLAAARLSGEPNTVTIFDVGEHAGRPYIVMEYLSGGSLDEVVRREGSLPPERAFTWLEQAGVALDAAHKEGVVHRDVKPANLMLDGDGNIHVADFGIASAAGLASLTVTGTVLGTAGYLSPEQAQGDRATPASDRYALAVVAFELLTSTRPFAADSPTAEAAAHVNAPVPSISSRSGLPPQLDPVFGRALAKDPNRRFATCADRTDPSAESAGRARVRSLPIADERSTRRLAAARRSAPTGSGGRGSAGLLPHAR